MKSKVKGVKVSNLALVCAFLFFVEELVESLLIK